MSLSVYTLWADRLIAGTHKLRDVPKAFRPQVQKILSDRKYGLNKNGVIVKKHGGNIK